jgi:hypothetical protein
VAVCTANSTDSAVEKHRSVAYVLLCLHQQACNRVTAERPLPVAEQLLQSIASLSMLHTQLWLLSYVHKISPAELCATHCWGTLLSKLQCSPSSQPLCSVDRLQNTARSPWLSSSPVRNLPARASCKHPVLAIHSGLSSS